MLGYTEINHSITLGFQIRNLGETGTFFSVLYFHALDIDTIFLDQL